MNQLTLCRGQDDQFLVFLLDEEGAPVNISGATAISLLLLKTDLSLLEKAPVNGMAVGVISQVWLYSFSISAAESRDLKLAVKQTIELKVTMGSGAIRYVPIRNCLSVVDLPF